jgi:hypothetical protein
MRYKATEDGVVLASGSGQTLDLGSGGVSFITAEGLTAGAFVELSISWPVLLDESCPMRLIVFGRVLRVSGRKAVCSVDKYEFRTQSRARLAVAPTRTDTMLQRWADGIKKGAATKVNATGG